MLWLHNDKPKYIEWRENIWIQFICLGFHAVVQLSDSTSLSVSLWPLRYKVQILNLSWHSTVIHKLTRETRDLETLNRSLKLEHCSQLWSLIFSSFSAVNWDVTVLVVDESHLQRCVLASEKTFCVFSRCQGAFFSISFPVQGHPASLYCRLHFVVNHTTCFLSPFFSPYLKNCHYCEEPGCVYFI